MTRYLHLHDADVDNAEYAELVDAYHDTRPTRADVDDRPEPIAPKRRCGCGKCLMCALQRSVEHAEAKR